MSTEPRMSVSSGEKIIPYRDRGSTLILWARSFLLLPWWGYLLLPIVGGILSRLGHLAYESGYILILMLGLYLFIEELLRRKIKVDDQKIYFGFHSYKLADLASVGLVYGTNKVVPKKLLLYFGAGVNLPLVLNRLDSKDFESLLNLVENRVPHCAIDPVIGTLTKGKRLARKAAMDETDRTEIVYHSRRFLKEMSTTFARTADGWTRVGPALTLVATAPIWLNAVNGPYSTMLSGHLNRSTIGTWCQMLTEKLGSIDSMVGGQIDKTGAACWQLISNPFVICLLVLSLVPFFYHIAKLMFKPNRIIVDASGCHLNLKVNSLSLPTNSISWSEVTEATLSKPSETSGPETWTISLKGTTKSSQPWSDVDLELAAINSEDRVRLSKAIQHWAPHCAMDTELAQTLLPRQTNSYTELWMQSLAAPSERANLEPLSSGRVLQEGRYEVIRRLGIGGQGAAYLCEDHEAHNASRDGAKSAATTKIVIKETILPVFVETIIRQQALERFDQEAQILRTLDNDHIVKLIDYFVEDHRGYLVLEWVDGTSLSQVIENRGPLMEAQVTDLCSQMCEMLDYLHERSILHRDFTPDNLILQKNGTLKLIDFNVAQQADESSTGIVVGKQAYMPAEQFRGKPVPQSDIYAMGATLYFLLTGTDPEPISQSCVQELKPQISDQLDIVIKKCTEIDSKKRFASVKDVAKLLRVERGSNEAVAAPATSTPKEFGGEINAARIEMPQELSEVEIDA